MDNMRILFCNYEYPPLGGGGGVINALLAQELATRHEVAVLTSCGPGLTRQEVASGVQIIRVPVYFRTQQAVANLFSMLLFIPEAIRVGRAYLRREPCDVVNTHFVLPTGPVGDHLARFAGVPNVLSLHGGDLYDPSKFTSPHRHLIFRTAVRALLRRADVVVGQSSNTLENMRRFYTRDVEGLHIPLGIRRPPPGSASRGSLGLEPNDVVLVTIGRLVARKAIDQLVHMVADSGIPNLKLLIIGTGPQRDHLQNLAEDLGVSDRVRFLGHVEEAAKFEILRACDVFVSTSQHEGFGLVFLEAMAAGLPVVCYDHGGQTDFLADETTGYLLPLNDMAGFLRCCRDLAHSAALRGRMGQENLRRVEGYFIDACARRYEELFAQAITARIEDAARTVY
jgi:glycosyltransferase involved in cell wall biosynthesis